MARELFSYDPTSGLSIYFDYDEQTETSSLEYVQDVEPLLERNKALAKDPDYSAAGIKDEMWHYGSIPVGLQMKWLIEEGLDVYDDDAWPQIFAKLNSPEYSYLKATTKSHGTRKLKAVKSGIWTPNDSAE